MFFDNQRGDNTYWELTRDLVQAQYELSKWRFAWENWTPKPLPRFRRGLFGKKYEEELRYERQTAEVESKREALRDYRRRMGWSQGSFWWELPWEKVLDGIRFDLDDTASDGPWRWERNWHYEEVNGATVLLLDEEGHCSVFSKDTQYEFHRDSPFSEWEIDSRLQELENKENKFEFWNSSLSSGPVRSESGRIYGSEFDYIQSAEHTGARARRRRELERSLFTRRETDTTYASSSSIHYQLLMAVGSYRIDGAGRLMSIAPMRFEIQSARGQVPPEITENYRQRDAAVFCAGSLALRDEVKSVPISLLAGDIQHGASGFGEALRQAEMYLCLANKLTLE